MSFWTHLCTKVSVKFKVIGCPQTIGFGNQTSLLLVERESINLSNEIDGKFIFWIAV